MEESNEVPVHVGPDDVHARPLATGHRRFDVIMATCAIFISAISLIVAVEHGRTERELVASNNWPFLRVIMTNRYGAAESLALGISNGGVGPAKVKSFELFLDHRPVSSPRELLRRCCGTFADPVVRRRASASRIITSVVDQTVLRPGEDNTILMLPRSETAPELRDALSVAFGRLTFHVCYCSILDECWTTDLQGVDAVKVPACPLPKHPYDFQGQ